MKATETQLPTRKRRHRAPTFASHQFHVCDHHHSEAQVYLEKKLESYAIKTGYRIALFIELIVWLNQPSIVMETMMLTSTLAYRLTATKSSSYSDHPPVANTILPLPLGLRLSDPAQTSQSQAVEDHDEQISCCLSSSNLPQTPGTSDATTAASSSPSYSSVPSSTSLPVSAPWLPPPQRHPGKAPSRDDSPFRSPPPSWHISPTTSGPCSLPP